MIYDHLSNISFYRNLSPNITLGLDFLKQVKPETPVGEYQINHSVKAIVSEYETKLQNENGFEAHKKFIDIQYLISGSEKLASIPVEKLKEISPYNEEKDIAFYNANDQSQEMIIGDGYFAIFFPQDGHMPQLSVDNPMRVKKVVIKIKI